MSGRVVSAGDGEGVPDRGRDRGGTDTKQLWTLCALLSDGTDQYANSYLVSKAEEIEV